ncbi:hypothetical protein CBR_g25799 [Chara braunii]|uniref:Uncharacterized protein n=1 Tax=Chara braunii TaxID=69332 RepID=A0A388L6E6_CHABU|nr:hypothetical protein CBR_g25799 [Chara braunii]|eukprot:GBG77867.1 hypothetical protein CBR_g25799 [Chara braunii]
MALVREIAYGHKTEQQRRRDEDDRRQREEQERKAKEEEMKKKEEEDTKEALKEARLAHIIDERIASLDKRYDTRLDEEKAKILEKVEKNIEGMNGKPKEKETEKGKGVEKGKDVGTLRTNDTRSLKIHDQEKSRKRGQEEVGGNSPQPLTPGRSKPNGNGSLEAGLRMIKLNTLLRQQKTSNKVLLSVLEEMKAMRSMQLQQMAAQPTQPHQHPVNPRPCDAPTTHAHDGRPSSSRRFPSPPRRSPPRDPRRTAPSPPPSPPPFTTPAPPQRANPPASVGRTGRAAGRDPTPHRPSTGSAAQREAAGPSTPVEGTSGRTSARLVDVFASVDGNAARRVSGSFSAIGASTGLGFDRVQDGTKAVMAGPGPEGRKKYVEEMTKVLVNKYKNDLVKMCEDEKIKYHYKKQAAADLAEIKARAAYDEEVEEEHVNEPAEVTQEENPS